MITSLPNAVARIIHVCPGCKEAEETLLRSERTGHFAPSRISADSEQDDNLAGQIPVIVQDRIEPDHIPRAARFDPASRPAWLPEALAKLEVHIAAARWEVAHGILEYYRTLASDEPLATSLSDLKLTARVFNALQQRGVETVADLIGKSEEWLAAIPQFGPLTVRQIYTAIAKLGFERRK